MASSYFLPQTARDGRSLVARPEIPSERTPLLTNTTPSIPTITISPSDPSDNRPLSDSIADASSQRPHTLRAATTVAAVHTSTVAFSSPARPKFGRAATTTTAFLDRRSTAASILSMDRSSPSLLRRATQAISQQLELGDGTSAAHRNAPAAPSNWNDHAHRRYLVKVWDSVIDVTANSSKYPKSTTALLVGTQQTMVNMFPELSEGDVRLSREWIEYVLGVALRHPFCTQEKMGRWEVLASSGSARMNWGPW